MRTLNENMHELEAFKKWVWSLTSDELLRAMEFQFIPDELAGNNSHEYDLLQQMVKLQPPPPTPIHPRAVSFRPATKLGVTDGRDESERTKHDRLHRPRLFQFIEREPIGINSLDHQSLRSGNGHRRRQRPNPPPAKRFDVLAKKFITPWGEVLSVGCTKEQLEADEAILLGTSIKYGSATDSKQGFFCRFPISSATISVDGSSNKLLRMLQVASRGKFISVPFPSQNDVGTKSRTSPNSTPFSFCAPWLDPTAQWFSLPLYLASRYEVSLWGAFRKDQKYKAPLNSLEDAMLKLSRERLIALATRAWSQVLISDVLPADATLTHFRDTTLSHLLTYRCEIQAHKQSAKDFLQSITATALVDVGSPKDTIRLLLQKRVQECLAHEVQKDLFDVFSSETGNGKTVENPSKRKRSKKKRRKKRKQLLPVLPEESNVAEDADLKSSGVESDGDVSKMIGNINIDSEVSYTHQVPSKERSRNIIAVLSIVNDVVETVFDRVGLNTKDETGQDNSANSNLVGLEITDEADYDPADVAESLKTQNEVDDIDTTPKANKRYEKILATSQLNPASAEYTPTNTTQTLKPPIQDVVTDIVKSQNDDDQLLSVLDVPPSASPEYSSFDVPYSEGLLETSSSYGYFSSFHDSLDQWGSATRYQSREKSIFAELFLRNEWQDETQDDPFMTSSTAASIASSSGVEDESDEDEEPGQILEVQVEGVEQCHEVYEATNEEHADTSTAVHSLASAHDEEPELLEAPAEVHSTYDSPITTPKAPASLVSSPTETSPDGTQEQNSSFLESPIFSPTPPEPITPPPQLSPILVSLEDIKKLRARSESADTRKERAQVDTKLPTAPLVSGSLPSSPVQTSSRTLTPSWSGEDLRATLEEHQQRIAKQLQPRHAGELLSYRSVTAKRLPRAPSSVKDGRSKTADDSAIRTGTSVPDLENNSTKRECQKDSCAQSETALEGHDEILHWKDRRVHGSDVSDNITTTRDGSATFFSHLSPQETEEIPTLREERNSFRDMCLTLGAEVAMLKNLLAAERGSKANPSLGYLEAFPQSKPYGMEFAPTFEGIPTGLTSCQTVGAMSDAGLHRGEYDSTTAPSEDGTDIAIGTIENPANPRTAHMRRMGSSSTIPASDASVDHSISVQAAFAGPPLKNPLEVMPSHGLQSRLTKDIINFLNATNVQLRKYANRRRLATERLSRLITALWPRAQLKMYGSHATGNCLPSSDLDFVICLPAVHKNAPADAPGVLEGRNAINETSQKLLARKLKAESWVDINTIKLIERTIVPVIKVCTKDTRARVLQLDISFDSAEHHGLEAIDMVKNTMQELPMIQPLMLVLKQFLLDRGLLTAFTGGLSSYGLFLMIARYLQEQSSWGDCGSLLMGFLDFYGNSFDPRTTGISVKQRQYFSRMNYVNPPVYTAEQPPMWNAGHVHHGMPSPVASHGSHPDLLLSRRHSFTDKGAREKGPSPKAAELPGPASTKHGLTRPPRFQPISSSSPRRFVPQFNRHPPQNDQSGRPYTFDPLFVEDPLSPGNNVGRNAFRIFQVQRAFSDAHRALVASLEWDIYSTGDLNDADYPLLKCLLQSEDVVFELEDPR